LTIVVEIFLPSQPTNTYANAQEQLFQFSLIASEQYLLQQLSEHSVVEAKKLKQVLSLVPKLRGGARAGTR
jgi:hypothetical protein